MRLAGPLGLLTEISSLCNHSVTHFTASHVSDSVLVLGIIFDSLYY
jgi:hypothetical protein